MVKLVKLYFACGENSLEDRVISEDDPHAP